MNKIISSTFVLILILSWSCSDFGEMINCTGVLDCNDICNGSSVLDECGICNGNGSTCNISYTDVQTILNNKCIDCHGNSYAEKNLNLSSYNLLMQGSINGAVIIPEKHVESILWQKVSSGEMPPSSSLSTDDIDLISTWIDEGALNN